MEVKSEVGKGTEVTVFLPLTRLAGTVTPISTPSSVATEGSAIDSIELLRRDGEDTVVALLGFHNSKAELALKEIIQGWFGLRIVQSSADTFSADLVIVDENEVYNFKRDRYYASPTIVLCTNDTRTDGVAPSHLPAFTEFVSKPVGPRKLAKAVQLCLQRAKAFPCAHNSSTPTYDGQSSRASETETVMPELGNLILERGTERPPLELKGNESVIASGSDNALMAIDHLSVSNGTSGGETVTGNDAFPFPSQSSATSEEVDTPLKENQPPLNRPFKKADLVRRDSRRPAITSRATEPMMKTPYPNDLFDSNIDTGTSTVMPPDEYGSARRAPHKEASTRNSLTTSNMALHNGDMQAKPAPKPVKEPEKRPPRLLLVDDNKINLRLLETYMRKRKFQYVDSAENGLLAVQAAETHQLGYDIIFMGKSHPPKDPLHSLRNSP